MSQLDMKRDHQLHGAGAGRDIIFQVGEDGVPRIFDRTAQELEWDLKQLRAKGLVVTDDLRLQMAQAEAVKKELELEARLARVKEEAIAKEMAKIAREAAGYEDDEDFDDLGDLVD